MSDERGPMDEERDPMDDLLTEYYRPLANVRVSAGLYGRTLNTLSERVEPRRPAWSQPRRRLLVGGLGVAVVAAVALSLLPWMGRGTSLPAGSSGPSGGQSGLSGSPSPSTSYTPLPAEAVWPAPSIDRVDFGSGPITAFNGRAESLTVRINYSDVGTIACGQVGHFAAPASGTSHLEVVDTNGTSASTDLPAGKRFWVLDGPDGVFSFIDTEPQPSAYVSVCRQHVAGADPSGSFRWSIDRPVVSGSAADARVNQAIQDAIEARRAAVGARANGARAGVTLRVTFQTPMVSQKWPNTLALTVLALRISYVTQGLEVPAPGDALTFDLRDGHQIGIDELFDSPAAGLAAVSREARAQLALTADGGDYAAGTGPRAANFRMWWPAPDGLHILFEPGQAPGYYSFGAGGVRTESGAEVTIAWSALDKLIRPDSIVRGVIP